MRFVALLVVVAIIYVAYSRRSSDSFATKAMKEADAVTETRGQQTTVMPPAAPPTTQPPTSGLRAPLDRTHAVLDQVKQRAAEPF